MVEKKLIDANALDLRNEVPSDMGGMCFIEDIETAIEQAPTVDAVPVVRCQYCQHWNENGWCKLIGQEFDRWPAYYCAEGIRKE